MCPAAWLLSPVGLTVTQAVTAENPNWGSLHSCFFICGTCTEDCDWNQRICSEQNKAQGTLTGLKDFEFVCIHSFFLFPHYLGLWEYCSTETSLSGKAMTLLERYTLKKIPASNEDLLTTSSSSVLRVTSMCWLQTYTAYLDTKDFMVPCNYKWDWLNFLSALFIFAHFCLVKIWVCFFFFMGLLCFVSVTAAYLKKKTPEMSTVLGGHNSDSLGLL